MRTHVTVAITAALLFAATACSSSDDNRDLVERDLVEPSYKLETDPEEKAALEQAVRDYTAALFSGDADGYKLVSARCRKEMSEAEFTAMAKDAHQQYGAQKATGIKVNHLAVTIASVSYGAGNIPQFDRKGQLWTLEGGTWRWDACPLRP